MSCFFVAVMGSAVIAYRRYRAAGQRGAAALALGALVFFLCSHINAIGQPHFESSYFAVPYFFLGGVFLVLRKHSASQGTAEMLAGNDRLSQRT